MKNRFVVVLRLGRMSVLQKREKALFIVKSMTGNPHFLNPLPLLSDIIDAVNDLDTAIIQANEGSRKANIVMHRKEAELARLLSAEGNYVENIANANPETGESIIIGAGMDFKKVHIRKASNFKVKNTEMPGEVKLRTKYADRAGFIWQYSINPGDDTSWITGSITNKASTIISSLLSGTRYYFRVAVLVNNKQQAWSEVVSVMVM